ncbi:MBL fold metallo-hydrolase [Priestia megaterium]|uniref:MBL fold metallo-hydrolase n=1 Tax=Priestia megaterium TaxID=1404 RepID=UPI000E197D92|nr:MBL fold metallo-hydrolase [Priestia megaterium]TPF18972.1 MBL fold metallo-hydrolase [Priestia megaterium]TPF23081.1 MBL fold metallo-hydrolase [Priestia megaterium]SUV06151.1 metal-dependent hydrolase [Priestia megaterium]
MRISEGVEMIQLTARAFNQDITLNPTLVWNNEEVILIDTGMPGQIDQLKEALNKLNMSIKQLKVILLTHQDLDHIGCAADIRNNSDKNIIVYAHEFDKPYIEGKLPLIKTNASQMSKEELSAIPDEIKYLYKTPPKVDVDVVLKGSQLLPYCGGIEVIFTPGHTPGHVSFYLRKSKTLVAGDTLVLANGQLMEPVKQTTLNMDQAVQSLEKFLNYEIEHVICYHGGYFQGCPKEAILRIKEHVAERQS